jgi:hypothetical protein
MASFSPEYKKRVEELSALIKRHDPANVSDEVPADESDLEAAPILAGIGKCRNEEECLALVWSVFEKYFGGETVGPRENFKKLSSEIWACFGPDS